MGRIRSMWKRYGYFLLPLVVGTLTGLLWVGSPGNKEYRLLTFLFLGMAAVGMGVELFRLGRRPGSAPGLTATTT